MFFTYILTFLLLSLFLHILTFLNDFFNSVVSEVDCAGKRAQEDTRYLLKSQKQWLATRSSGDKEKDLETLVDRIKKEREVHQQAKSKENYER